MARQTGDLWPATSGSASLGAEQINGAGGFSREIRPFRHIHLNSGVFHPGIGGTSGVIRFADTSLSTTRGFELSVNGGANYNLSIGAEKNAPFRTKIETVGRLAITAGDNRSDLVDGNFVSQANNSMSLIALQDLGSTASHQININAFLGSGHLSYQFGPYEAWHTRVGAGNSTLVPIPHSGHVLQMILENGGGGSTDLQGAYDNGPRITTTSPNGPVHIDASTTYGLRLDASEGGHSHILWSGVSNIPATTTIGSVWLQGHSAGELAQLRGQSEPNTRAIANALSLGIDQLFYQTGSGIAHVRHASGVSQFFNVAASDAIDENGLIVPVNLQTTPSNFYHVQAVSGVQIFVPGKYKIQYTAIMEKFAGNLAQVIKTELQVYDKNGNGQRLLGSQSAAMLRDSNNLNVNSCNGQWIGDLHPGEALILFAEHQGAPPAGNSARTQARASNVIVEWISPLSAGGVTRQSL